MSTRPAASRQVQRLHLRAPDETLARRGVRLLEDALRTASLPDAGAQVLIFRRLALGRFSAKISPQALALALERRIAALRGVAVHATDPLAEHAVVVWFRDALEAHTLLAQRIAEDTPTREWFWPLVVPEIERGGTALLRLRVVLRSLGQLPEAPTAWPLLSRALAARGHTRLLNAAVGAAEAARLLGPSATVAQFAAIATPTLSGRMSVVTDVADQLEATDTAIARAPPGVRTAQSIASAEAATPPDSRSFDHPMPMRPAHSSPADQPMPIRPAATRAAASEYAAAAPQLPSESRVQKDANIALLKERGETDAATAKTLQEGRDGNGVPTPVDTQRPLPARPAASDRLAQDPVTARADLAAPRSTSAPGRDEASSGAVQPLSQPCGLPTAAGGLLFLLPVLARLGYARWLDEAPDWVPLHIQRRVFRLACSRLDLPADDPAWQLCKTSPEPQPDHYCAPPIWTEGIADCNSAWRRYSGAGGTRLWDGSGRLLLAAWPGGRRPTILAARMRSQRITRYVECPRDADDLAMAVTDAWLSACRRWLRRSAGLGVASLVTRPAKLSLTPTHADMSFDLAGVSLAVRRAGLDLDPGWIPWFGRVVSFHYGRAPWT
jgi:hypothetical protein